MSSSYPKDSRISSTIAILWLLSDVIKYSSNDLTTRGRRNRHSNGYGTLFVQYFWNYDDFELALEMSYVFISNNDQSIFCQLNVKFPIKDEKILWYGSGYYFVSNMVMVIDILEDDREMGAFGCYTGIITTLYTEIGTVVIVWRWLQIQTYLRSISGLPLGEILFGLISCIIASSFVSIIPELSHICLARLLHSGEHSH